MNSICSTCGTQFADTPQPPVHCPVCEDERQYVGLAGQTWTTLNELRDKYKTKLEQEEDRLLSFSIDPHFAIGQRAFLVQTAEGNLLWDCLSLMDQETVNLIHANGGLDAIAISHPHYYASMVEWSQEFGNVPVYLHGDDAQWVMRPDACIQFWHGETKEIWSGLTLIRSGGHFAGGTVLHWNAGAERKGALLTGDIIQVVPDRCHVSFMYSFRITSRSTLLLSSESSRLSSRSNGTAFTERSPALRFRTTESKSFIVPLSDISTQFAALLRNALE